MVCPKGLNPRAFMSALKPGQTSDEVSLRRAVSSVFFSLFNYWALKHYLKGNRGQGPMGDWSSITDFTEFLYSRGLDREAYTLLVYRVAADHYALNPTVVRVSDRHWRGAEEKVSIDDRSVKLVLKAAEAVLEAIENY